MFSGVYLETILIFFCLGVYFRMLYDFGRKTLGQKTSVVIFSSGQKKWLIFRFYDLENG